MRSPGARIIPAPGDLRGIALSGKLGASLVPRDLHQAGCTSEVPPTWYPQPSGGQMLKLAITGKGGVGKTTLSALLAHVFAERGHNVLAIDADPATGLAAACGVPLAQAAAITPVADMEELIYERTGARKGEIGGFFKLNPRVDDIPDRFSVVSDGIRILTMGTVKAGGTGCLCPENALLRSLVTHLLL
ncbi:MAG: AAA family ATPase, partial [Anaerolineae bacterium]|nr:AAA family ATPase [Anaerolineae bacterium]